MLNKFAIMLFVALLTGCGGGGDSETSSGGGEMPTTPDDTSTDTDTGTGGTSETPNPPAETTLSCSKNPAGTAALGQTVTAVFNISQTFNGTATIQNGIQGGLAESEETAINGTQVTVERTLPNNEFGTYVIRLTATTGITASCSWTIAVDAIIAI